MDGIKFALGALIILIICLIVFWRASIVLIYNGGTALKIRTCFFTITLVDTNKSERVKKHKYSEKAIDRRKKREEKKAAKRRTRKSDHTSQEKKKKFNFTFPDDIERLLSAFSSLFNDLLLPIVRNGRVKFRYFKLTVASPDPADTAIRYGVLSQAAAYFLHALAINTKISKRQLKKVKLGYDFLQEKTTFELHMTVTFSVWKLLFLLIFKGRKFFERLTKFSGTSDVKTDKKSKVTI